MSLILRGLIALVGIVAGAWLYLQRKGAKIPVHDPLSFIIQHDDDEADAARERVLPLEGGANFRDLGGYRAADGRRVRWGRVFRAGSLANLTDADLAHLDEIGLKLVCDLRSYDEVRDAPDRLPDSAPEYMHLPLEAGDDTPRRLRAIFWDRRLLTTMMLDAYTRIMIDQNAALLGDVLRRLADPDNLPAVFHCTAGKDRTGVTAALLLSVLGVPDAVIVADYTLSNHFYENFRAFAEQAMRPIGFTGVKAEDLQPLLIADAATMQGTLDHIREKYGSVEAYLLGPAGLDAEVIDALRANLLE